MKIKQVWNFSEIFISQTLPHPTDTNLFNIVIADKKSTTGISGISASTNLNFPEKKEKENWRKYLLSIPLDDARFFQLFQERIEAYDTNVHIFFLFFDF